MQNWFTSCFLWRCFVWCSTDSRGQSSFITFWLFVFVSAYLSIKNLIFRTVMTLDNYIYQTHKRNIMKFYLLIPRHLVIQLAKLHIDILKLKTTFWHCEKNPITFGQGCTYWIDRCCKISSPVHTSLHLSPGASLQTMIHPHWDYWKHRYIHPNDKTWRNYLPVP